MAFLNITILYFFFFLSTWGVIIVYERDSYSKVVRSGEEYDLTLPLQMAVTNDDYFIKKLSSPHINITL